MTAFIALTKRNTKLFFKDKGMFFTSLITPIILLVLYATFLAKVYRESFTSAIPEFMSVSDKLIDGCVGGQLFSSLLAVSCVTVAFCSNMIMVQDKVNGSRADLTIAPVKRSALALSYYFSTVLVTMIVCLLATGVCFIYLANVGWFLSVADVLYIVLDVLLLVLFGTVLSSIINFFLATQGQISAVGTVVSAGYGFLCGAYMPISSFGEGLQKVLAFLPGTYGTALVRNHALDGVFSEMLNQSFPPQAVDAIRDSIDCNLYFFGDKVSVGSMYAILGTSVGVLIAIYVLLNLLKRKAK